MSNGAHQHGPLWAITAYFNPARYQNRRKNYRLFRQRLDVPLVAVELSFDGQFELEPDDAEVLIQIAGGDVMWQKERLLNIALESLPRECEFVIWLDCDIVFQRRDWPEQVCQQLERVPLLQPYSLVHHLPRTASPQDWGIEPGGVLRPSAAWLVAQGASPRECLGAPAGTPGIRAPGHAWAVRRDLIEQHRFYDFCIIGGGDTVMACAAYGVFEVVQRVHSDNVRAFEHYLRWARPFFGSVQGQVSLVEGDLLHLWHGELSDRRSRQRHRGLAEYNFDPAVDIAVGENRCWRWNSAKREMHQFVAKYFLGRNEDGLVCATARA